MRISDLKFGDKFTYPGSKTVCVFYYKDEKNDFHYLYMDDFNDPMIGSSTYDDKIEPVGSVEQDKKLVWINSSERAPTTNDCDSGDCIYTIYKNMAVRLHYGRVKEYFGDEPYLWCSIPKPPALPEPEYKLVEAEFPRDWNKIVYSNNRTKLGVLIGFDNNTLAKYIVKRSVMAPPVNYNYVYTLEK